MFGHLKDIYEYREMINNLVKKELIARYKKSILGFLWTFINPLCQLIIYTLVFSYIMDMRASIDNFPVFLMVALIPWLFFSTAVSASSMSIITQQDMVKKIYFPRQVLPISCVTSNFINMLFCFVIVFLAIVLWGIKLNVRAILFLPLVMLTEYMFTLGLSLIVAACTVYLRDLEHIIAVLMQAWLYLTPVVYSLETVPSELLFVLKLNPMTHITQAYRNILYYGIAPELKTLMYTLILSGLLVIIGDAVFEKLQKGFAEEL